MTTKKLLLATSNPAKLSEMKTGLASLKKIGWQLFSLQDLGITDSPEETGKTFKQNAFLKAQFYAEKVQMKVVSDDGGFVIPYLNGEPGVRSARWLGENSDEAKLVEHTLFKLKKAKGKQRAAYLELVLCFFDPNKNLLLFENEKIKGIVADKPTQKRINGFPYRSLLIIDGFNKYYDELSSSEHQAVNHRFKALAKLQQKLLKMYHNFQNRSGN